MEEVHGLQRDYVETSITFGQIQVQHVSYATNLSAYPRNNKKTFTLPII